MNNKKKFTQESYTKFARNSKLEIIQKPGFITTNSLFFKYFLIFVFFFFFLIFYLFSYRLLYPCFASLDDYLSPLSVFNVATREGSAASTVGRQLRR